jgi:hypothetical protein
LLIVALLVATAAAGAGGRHREQEAKGYLDHLLARPVSRLSWLAGRVAVAAAVLVAAGLVIGLLTWVGATNVGANVRLTTLLAAAVNVIPAGILVLGVGTLVHGLAPSLTEPWPTAWSFLVEFLGASLGLGRWLLDTSLLHHLTCPPAAQVRWDSAALVALGLAAPPSARSRSPAATSRAPGQRIGGNGVAGGYHQPRRRSRSTSRSAALGAFGQEALSSAQRDVTLLVRQSRSSKATATSQDNRVGRNQTSSNEPSAHHRSTRQPPPPRRSPLTDAPPDGLQPRPCCGRRFYEWACGHASPRAIALTQAPKSAPMRDGMLWRHARHMLPEVIAATRGNVLGERGDGGTDD